MLNNIDTAYTNHYNDRFNYCIKIMFTLILYYTSYRYPLMINSTETSPTYTDTPTYLQVIKYFIFFATFMILFFKYLIKRKVPIIKNWIIFYLYICLFLPPIFYAILSQNNYLFSLGFFFIIPITIHLFFQNGALNFNSFSQMVSICIIIFIIVNALQVILFFSIGRLPALAYKNSFSVRFGSLLDDPNSFGILLSMFIGFALHKYCGYMKIIIITLLIICLIITQSLTALIFVPFSIFIVSIIYFKTYYKILLTMFFITLIFATLFYSNYDSLEPFIRQKQRSATAHSGSLVLASEIDLIAYFGIAPAESPVESGYINILTTMGILYVVAFLVLGVITAFELISLLFVSNDSSVRSVLLGSLCFLISFYLSCINLPFEKIFPINALAYLLIGLTTSGSLRRGIINI